MPSPAAARNGWNPVLWFAPPFLVGLVLRLYGLSSQIPLDDEWHSLNFVLDKSFVGVLTTHGLGANCIPQNLINWILLHTVGWSELALALPSVLLGVLGLLIFPWLVSRLADRTVALLFSWLLAISPGLIFYSRIARPYSMVLFFGFWSLLCLALWTREGRPRQLLAYALSGFAAIYFHLYAALPVGAAGLAVFISSIFPRGKGTGAPWISPRALSGAGSLMLLLLVVFLGPAHWRNPWWSLALGQDRVTAQGLWDFLSLLAGTRFVLGKLLIAALAGYGLHLWLKKEFRIGLLFLSAWAAFFLLLAFATQDGMHAGIQIARYNIVLFPVAMLMVAAGLEALFARLPSGLRIAAGILLIGGLVAGSPLWRTFDLPNNFMHHSAFQDSYAPFDESQSRLRLLTPMPQMPKSRIAPFYFNLAAAAPVRGLIEYPMYIGDPLNLHWYTQHFHRKPVAIGYVPDFPFPPLPSKNDFIYQATPADYVFSRTRELGLEGKLHFRNLVPLTDVARLRRDFPGWVLIVHRDILQETLGIRNRAGLHPPEILEASLIRTLGAPAFSDRQIVAWQIP
ncbi:MAG TPA: hypothetical protein DCM68_08880 [Verrucomicrobia bacterium]|nr:hypothetical protein [Verrucomicrobiota bacterium]